MGRNVRAFTVLYSAQNSQKKARATKMLALLRMRLTMRERNYLTANVLISPSKSAWAVLYASHDDSAFMVTVSLPVLEFNVLLAAFSNHYMVKSGPGKRGRPPRLQNKNNVLACLLHFHSAAVEAKTLCELFGVPPATLSRVLKNAEKALSNAIRDVPAARISWPTFGEQERWAAMVTLKEPLIRGCFCLADGKNYAVRAPTASDVQNAYFNGWLHAVKVTGVLCYGFDGTLIWGRHNFPGSWNDGEMSRRLQARLADGARTLAAGCCATDSAFPVSNDMTGRIITPLKDGDLEKSSPECRAGLIVMSNAITAIRQAAEWGMGCAPKVYRQLLLPLPFDPNRRSVRLENIYHLYNLRVRATGVSQIEVYTCLRTNLNVNWKVRIEIYR